MLLIRLPDILRGNKLEPKAGPAGEILLLNPLGARVKPGLLLVRPAEVKEDPAGGGEGDLPRENDSRRDPLLDLDVDPARLHRAGEDRLDDGGVKSDGR